MSNDTLSIKDNATGAEVEYPLLKGTLGNQTVDIKTLNRDLGRFTYDPGFVSTASCKSSITYIDGVKGILLYRGYPIEQLAKSCGFLEVAYLLTQGELPTDQQLSKYIDEVNHSAVLHESLRSFFEGFHHDAHPMAMMVGVVGSLSAFYHSELDVSDP